MSDALKLAGAALADHLDKVATALERGGVTEAAQLVSVLDDRDPTVAYVKAVVTLHQEGPGRVTEARRLLRRATEQAVYPAFVLTGEVLFRLAQMMSGRQPGSNTSPSTIPARRIPRRAELAAEAVLWWSAPRPSVGLRAAAPRYGRASRARARSTMSAPRRCGRTRPSGRCHLARARQMLMLGHGLQPNSPGGGMFGWRRTGCGDRTCDALIRKTRGDAAAHARPSSCWKRSSTKPKIGRAGIRLPCSANIIFRLRHRAAQHSARSRRENAQSRMACANGCAAKPIGPGPASRAICRAPMASSQGQVAG